MTSQHSKHPDWDELWENVQNEDHYWLLNYIKSHDINRCRDEHGNTLLHCAAGDENEDAIAYLSLFFIDPNIKNAAGQTALQLSQDTPFLPLYPTFHECHLCIDFVTASTKPNGLDALFAAIYRGDATLGDTSGVEDDGNEKNAGQWTALHCAVVYDRPHLIRELHQRFPKLDADCLNYHKHPALFLAAMYGHSSCIIALCECFPAIDAGDALQAACSYNRPACIPTLRQCFPQLSGNEFEGDHEYSSALMRAALHNNPECIRALHSCFPDIDPNLQDNYGNTALIVTMQYPGRHECIPALSECFSNIDPNKGDNNGDTALMHASEQELPQSITLLATYFPSIDVNMRNKEGKTALMWAIKHNNEKCLIALCESFPNIDPNAQDKFGQTALMFAIRQDYFGFIIPQLRKRFPNKQYTPEPIISQLRKVFPNIDPNTQDKGQNTALMYLLRSPDCTVEYVRRFLDSFPNVDVKAQNAQSETTLTLAIKQDKAPIVDLLLERFPDLISFATSIGQTALMLATKKPSINSISILLKLIAQMQ